MRYCLNIPSGTEFIGSYAFAYCENLTEIIIPDTVGHIGEYAFQGSGLKEVVIPDSVKVIDHAAFAHCTALAKVKLSSSVEELNSTFSDCTALRTITIPESVKNLSGTFSGCEDLEIEIPDSVENLTGTFLRCNNIKVTLPDTLTEIPTNTFLRANGLTVIYRGKTYNNEKELYMAVNGTDDVSQYDGVSTTTGTDAMTTTAADTTTSTAEVETTADTTSIPEDSSAYTAFRELSMWDVLPEIEKTGIDDLVFHYDETLKGAVVDGYTGSSDKVRIPEMVWDDGVGEYIVVAVDLSESEIAELILPDTLKKLSYNKSTVKYINYPCYLEMLL